MQPDILVTIDSKGFTFRLLKAVSCALGATRPFASPYFYASHDAHEPFSLTIEFGVILLDTGASSISKNGQSNRVFRFCWFVSQDAGFWRAPLQIRDLEKAI